VKGPKKKRKCHCRSQTCNSPQLLDFVVVEVGNGAVSALFVGIIQFDRVIRVLDAVDPLESGADSPLERGDPGLVHLLRVGLEHVTPETKSHSWGRSSNRRFTSRGTGLRSKIGAPRRGPA
jgi:hypothetical protein